jgi:hypothetical protein
MRFPRPVVDIRRPPEGLDALVDWFELVSYDLVLLEEFSLDEIRIAVARIAQGIETHGRSAERSPPGPVAGSPELEDLGHILSADHDWFRTSVDQLWWFFGVVEREDHGGHRQALGQYGRVLCEAVRRHRAMEEEFVRRSSDRRQVGTTAPPPGNAN